MTEGFRLMTSDTIIHVQHRFWAALQHKNRAEFEEILAPDFVSRSPAQANEDREAFINTLTSFPMKVLSVGSDNLEVHVFEDVAVISGVQTAQIELPDGKVVPNVIAITNILQQQGGKWLMKLAHAVEMK
jgi:hypothetical protein